MTTAGYSGYEPVIGLEIHVQLGLNSKIFCRDRNEYGSDPNILISEVSLGYPGVLPRLNEKAVKYAVKLGLALHCDISREVTFDRKHYFYPDLPKGFQTTQERNPINTNGYITLLDDDGKEKRIGLRKIHLEEDAGKSIHDEGEFTLLDFNRAGAALVEIVTLPEISSPGEASSVMNEVRKLIRFLEISDGNMEEGSLRCDANISVRREGEEKLGKKVEIKNINSMKFVQKALEFEFRRQIGCLERGEEIVEETRSYHPSENLTTSMRSKETVEDYRYFPEPDLPSFKIDDTFINEIRSQLGVLPLEIKKRLLSNGITENEAEALSSNKDLYGYFEVANRISNNEQLTASWLLGPVKTVLNEEGIGIEQFPVSAEVLGTLMSAVQKGAISHNLAVKEVFPILLKDPESDLSRIIEELRSTADGFDYVEAIGELIKSYPSEFKQYSNGKSKLFGFFMGELMKRGKGKIDPKKAKEALTKELAKS